ncbi:MAG: LytR C-terminal domain-containing protein, partial [Candidatus Bipolaricaulaceae bacterium]
ALAALWDAPFLAGVEVSPASWDALVEELGGVVARPAERLIYQDPFRQVFIDIPAGEQLLGGPKSREFLAYLLQYGGERNISELRKFFTDLVERLAGRARALRNAFAPPTLSPWAAQDFWQAVAQAQPRLEVLPTVEEAEKLLPDVVRMRKLREALFFGRVFLTREEVGVFLVNGTRERFLATRTAAWLSGRGFRVVGVGQADRPDYTKTLLLVGKGAEEKAELLRAVLPKEVSMVSAEAFGVERLGGWPEGADVVLLLGAGFDVGA